MLYRNLSLFLSSTDKASFRITRAIYFLNVRFRYGNAMQEVGNQVVSDDEKNFSLMWNLWKPEMSVILEDEYQGSWPNSFSTCEIDGWSKSPEREIFLWLICPLQGYARLDLTFLGMRLSGAIHKRNGHGTNGHFYLEKILVQVRIRRCMTRRKSGFFDSVIHKKSPFGSPFFVISYSKVFSRIGLFGRCKPVFLAWLDDFEISIVTCLTHRNRDYSTPTPSPAHKKSAKVGNHSLSKVWSFFSSKGAKR